jgi:hypothetical protein
MHTLNILQGCHILYIIRESDPSYILQVYTKDKVIFVIKYFLLQK